VCGILFCAWQSRPVAGAAFEAALATMAHRGPDHRAFETGTNFAIGHARLSIIDLSPAANQPFADATGRWSFSYNGEIYNYEELRRELVERGVPLRTSSDMEVLLELLVRDGIERTLARVRGMFAFVLVDRQTGRFVAARDHFGQKPLYHFEEGGRIAVASDIRALLALKSTVSPNVDVWPVYLASNGIVLPEDTFFDGICAIPAGAWLEGSASSIGVKRYFEPWSLFDHAAYRDAAARSDDDAVDGLEAVLRQAVERHLVSDVPVGVLLSGGIDSSLVYWYTGNASRKLTAFTKVSPGIETIPAAVVPKLLADRPAHAVTRIETPETYTPRLVDFIEVSQFPSRWGGGPPMTALCREARARGTTVLLGGDCVDEYAAGYRTLEPLMDGTDDDPHRLHSIVDLDRGMAETPGTLRFIAAQHDLRRRILEHLGELGDRGETLLQATLLHDVAMFLPACNLPHSDAYSMAASVELRNPMLDIDLVRYVVNQPGRRKFARRRSGHRNKIIFRDLAARRIGDYVNVEKEGTRNYSMAISRAEYWNLDAFSIGQQIPMPDSPGPKLLFKLINLECHTRLFFEKQSDFLPALLTPAGMRSILGSTS
jgi:asparagine synthase (glutamine-hydrolysing)